MAQTSVMQRVSGHHCGTHCLPLSGSGGMSLEVLFYYNATDMSTKVYTISVAHRLPYYSLLATIIQILQYLIRRWQRIQSLFLDVYV
jgi:hypothetical protein